MPSDNKKNILSRGRLLKAKALFNSNRLEEAHHVCAQVCEKNRNDAQALILFSMINRRRGHYSDAEQASSRAIALRPGSALAHQTQAMAVQCQGRIEEAISSYRKALKLGPDKEDLPYLHYLLGNALREYGALAEADVHYQKALELQPDFLQALSNRGANLLALGNWEEAEICLRRANQIQPDLPQVLCNIAQVMLVNGRFDEARVYFQDVLARYPNFLDAIAMLAELHERSNEYNEARQFTKRGLSLAPDHVEINLIAAKLERRDNRIADAITRLEGLRARVPENAQSSLLLLLGQLYDKNKDTEKAFKCLCEGNRMKAEAILSNQEDGSRYLGRIAKLRTKFLSESPNSWQVFEGDDFHDNPIFLFGFPRSGTTLLEQILDSHSRLQAIEEKPTISAVEQALHGRSLCSISLEEIHELRKVYFTTVAQYIRRDKSRIIVDKTPLNTIHAHLIWRLFPKAKCILAIRHPCDVTLSCFMQDFVINDVISSFFTLEETAEVYAAVMSLWQTFIAALPIDYCRIRYEDLVADQAGESRRLLEYLGLEWDEKVLRHDEHARKRNVMTASYHQVSQPIYQDAKYRWKRYTDFLRPVIPILQPFIEYFDYGESENEKLSNSLVELN